MNNPLSACALNLFNSSSPKNPMVLPWFAWCSSSESAARWMITSWGLYFLRACSVIAALMRTLVSGTIFSRFMESCVFVCLFKGF